ncbi:MAG: hypothetical protein HZA53_02300 [Planctomycetes bacterium]|nr:hypothetical protein [Planctomycetota bacterium]
MKKRPILLALLCVSTACRSSDEHVANPPPTKSTTAVAVPAVPPKQDKAQAAAALPIVPAKKAKPAESATPAVPALPTANSAEEPKAAAVGTRAERFEALEAEHDQAMNAYYDLFRDAKSQEEMQAISKTAKAPDAKPFVERAKALLAEDAKDETALKAIQWLFENARDAASNAELCTLLEQHHLGSKAIADLLRHLSGAGPAGMQLVEKLAEKSPHEDVRGRALMQLGDGAMEDRRYAAMLKDMPEEERKGFEEYLGAERLAQLKALDDATAEKQAIALFERVRKEYGAVKVRAGTPYESTLGDSAAANLFEIENLAVGKQAPEIAGEDVAGVAFKLSDYRGMVVMLDCWGFW